MFIKTVYNTGADFAPIIRITLPASTSTFELESAIDEVKKLYMFNFIITSNDVEVEL